MSGDKPPHHTQSLSCLVLAMAARRMRLNVNGFSSVINDLCVRSQSSLLFCFDNLCQKTWLILVYWLQLSHQSAFHGHNAIT